MIRRFCKSLQPQKPVNNALRAVISLQTAKQQAESSKEAMEAEAALFDELPNPAGYAWLLRNVRPVKAFNVRGMPGLFEVEDNLIKYL